MLATCFVAVVKSATKLVRIEQNSFGKHHRLVLRRVEASDESQPDAGMTQQMSLRFRPEK
jgi:hypothetical protein